MQNIDCQKCKFCEHLSENIGNKDVAHQRPWKDANQTESYSFPFYIRLVQYTTILFLLCSFFDAKSTRCQYPAAPLHAAARCPQRQSLPGKHCATLLVIQANTGHLQLTRLRYSIECTVNNVHCLKRQHKLWHRRAKVMRCRKTQQSRNSP